MTRQGNLPVVAPKFDAERAANLAKHVASYDRFADHTADFEELVENNSRGVVDDAVRGTADARYGMGLKPMIRRSQIGQCCPWCAEVAGEYEYSTRMDKSVFRRHRGCDCLIELFRDGRHEVVENYTRWDSRWDEGEIRRRVERIQNNGQSFLDEARHRLERLHPFNPVTHKRYTEHPLVITDNQFGKKLGRHAKDFGINPRNKRERDRFRAIINDIVTHAEERVWGEFLGQDEPVLFHINGQDVVLEGTNGEFISILKGGVNNERVKVSRK